MNQQKVLRHFQIPCPISGYEYVVTHTLPLSHCYIYRLVTIWLSFWPKISLIVHTIRIHVPLHPPFPLLSHGSSCLENCSTHFFSGICVHQQHPQQPLPPPPNRRIWLGGFFSTTDRPWTVVGGSGYRKAYRDTPRHHHHDHFG